MKGNMYFVDGSDVRTAVYDYTCRYFYSSYMEFAKSHNVLEYEAVYEALILAENDDTDMDALIFSDSQLIVRQLTGVYQVKERHLKDQYDKIINICKSFKIPPQIYWIPREQNLAGICLEHGFKAKFSPDKRVDWVNMMNDGGRIMKNDV